MQQIAGVLHSAYWSWPTRSEQTHKTQVTVCRNEKGNEKGWLGFNSDKPTGVQTERETFGITLVGRIILKIIFKQLYGRAFTGFIWLVIGTSCKHGNEASGSIKWWELIDQLEQIHGVS